MNETVSILFSIVVPVYNMGDYLVETIESVLSQTYKNWELILVDDGSIDNSPDISRSYKNAYADQIIYLEHPERINKGVCATRNLGISQAKGDWIALLDADDIWLPEKLSKQVALINENPTIGMLCEAACYWSSWQNKDDNDKIVLIGDGKNGLISPPLLLEQLYPLGEGQAPSLSGTIFRKEVWQKVGKFEEHFQGIYTLYEDQGFLNKVYLTEFVYISTQCNHLYRQRQGSMLHSGHSLGHYDIVRKYFLSWFKKYLKHHGVKDPRVWFVLNRALYIYKPSIILRAKQFLNRVIKNPLLLLI